METRIELDATEAAGTTVRCQRRRVAELRRRRARLTRGERATSLALPCVTHVLDTRNQIAVARQSKS